MCVAGHDEQNRDGALITARSFKIVGQVLENQPFIGRAEGGGHLSEIIR